MSELRIGKDAFSKYKRELVESGYLTVEQMRVGGRFKSNIYNIVLCLEKILGGEPKSPSTNLKDMDIPCMDSAIPVTGVSTNNILFTNNKNYKNNSIKKNILSSSEKIENKVKAEEDSIHDILHNQKNKHEKLENQKKSDDSPYSKIVDYLNSMSGKKYKSSTNKTRNLIKARFNEGFTEEDFIKVINIKVKSWKDNEMDMYLRPSTLFGIKFEEYLNENPNVKTKKREHKIWVKEKKSSFNDFEQRAYDGKNGQPTMKELERMLLDWSN
ncbi:conserved phage C-terminal domain-containing protein [Oceanirhabdus seepicola]|uniref:Conserved phage C-terminal domain-containing protein n=2 Tax=Oceanirhabdus seepicola TaxID=2828781 RepID=A0A9J6NY60_9CLOT|nr:conserved phage C-terminal domain-containing protein [Oceanirhabdus seepicola]